MLYFLLGWFCLRSDLGLPLLQLICVMLPVRVNIGPSYTKVLGLEKGNFSEFFTLLNADSSEVYERDLGF